MKRKHLLLTLCLFNFNTFAKTSPIEQACASMAIKLTESSLKSYNQSKARLESQKNQELYLEGIKPIASIEFGNIVSEAYTKKFFSE